MPIDIESLAIGKANGSGGGDITTEKLTVTKNGTYQAPSGKAYNPVRVDVPTISLDNLDITENGSYTAENGKGYKTVNVEVETYPEPTGKKTITENGENIDVKDFAKVDVNVEIPMPEIKLQNKTVTENGIVEADLGFDGLGKVNVAVEGGGGYPEPTGSITITTNGTYDVKDKAESVVNVESRPNETLCKLSTSNYGKEILYIQESPIYIHTRFMATDTSVQGVLLTGNVKLGKTSGDYPERAFNYCENLKYIIIPTIDFSKTTQVATGSYYFDHCTGLKFLLIESFGINLGSTAFNSTPSLKSIVITRNTVQPISANALNGSGIFSGNGFVYVPDSLVETYKTTTNWVAYENKIKGFSESSAYDVATTYTVGDVCKHKGKMYAWKNLVDGNTEPSLEVKGLNDDWFCVAEV